MNNSTSTVDNLYIGLLFVDQVINYYCICVHISYIILAIFLKDLRLRSLLFINHAVVASVQYPIGNLVIQFVNVDELTNRHLAHLVCSTLEIFWPFAVYIRMYSILLIAFHRYLAVFHMDLFKRISCSILYSLSAIVLTWLVCICLPLAAKYLFSTAYYSIYCLPGFSNSQLSLIMYSVFYYFWLVVPTVWIIVIYVKITKKLDKMGTNLLISTDRAYRHKPVFLSFKRVANRLREIRFARQYILMCIIVVLTIGFLAVFRLKGFFNNYFVIFHYWRPVIRICVCLLASMIPIVSFYYNPSRKKIFKLFRNH